MYYPVKEYVSRGAAEGFEILKSGGGMSVIWQCGLESVLSRGECLFCKSYNVLIVGSICGGGEWGRWVGDSFVLTCMM